MLTLKSFEDICGRQLTIPVSKRTHVVFPWPQLIPLHTYPHIDTHFHMNVWHTTSLRRLKLSLWLIVAK